MKNVFIVLTISWFTLQSFYSYSKGKSGHYSLVGFAITKSGDTLKNQQILITFKNTVSTILTDSNGYYKTTIRWASPCRSNVPFFLWKRHERKANPKYIFFSFQNKKVKVQNNWKKFVVTHFDDNSSSTNTQTKNLIF